MNGAVIGLTIFSLCLLALLCDLIHHFFVRRPAEKMSFRIRKVEKLGYRDRDCRITWDDGRIYYGISSHNDERIWHDADGVSLKDDRYLRRVIRAASYWETRDNLAKAEAEARRRGVERKMRIRRYEERREVDHKRELEMQDSIDAKSSD